MTGIGNYDNILTISNGVFTGGGTSGGLVTNAADGGVITVGGAGYGNSLTVSSGGTVWSNSGGLTIGGGSNSVLVLSGGSLVINNATLNLCTNVVDPASVAAILAQAAQGTNNTINLLDCSTPTP